MKNFVTQLQNYLPFNEQESVDKQTILTFVKNNPDAFLRSNTSAHVTASSWIVNKDFTKVLMVYHKIYNSWSWTGGHCDGDTDTLAVALREATEETGVQATPLSDEIYSVECLTVDGHRKNGNYVGSHLHLNVTYLLQADDRAPLTVNEGENTAVKWFDLDEALSASTEPWFVERIYSKLNLKLARFANKK